VSLTVTGIVSDVPDTYTNRAGDVTVTLVVQVDVNTDFKVEVPVVIGDDSLINLVLRDVSVGTAVVITARKLTVETRGEKHRAVVVASDVKVAESKFSSIAFQSSVAASGDLGR
jgi:hypothetical protein